MACANCGNSILFGGKKAGLRKYCSKWCLEEDQVGRVADTIEEYEAELLADKIRHSKCPNCDNIGNIEVFKSYFIYSVILYTSWKENAKLSCRSCARKQQIKDFVASFLVGWWGVPLGVLGTPIVLIMNLVSYFSDPSFEPPSKELKEHARYLIANQILNNNINDKN